MVQRRARSRVLSIVTSTLAGIVVVGVLAGCGAGVEAGTLDPAPASGAQADAGDLRIRNALLVVSDDDSGTGVIALTIVNNGATDDALVAIEVPTVESTATTEPVTADLRPRSIELLAGRATVIPTADRPYIELETDATAGTSIEVVLKFEVAGAVTLRLPVVAATGPYATVTTEAA